jgi:hypothetical protein
VLRPDVVLVVQARCHGLATSYAPIGAPDVSGHELALRIYQEQRWEATCGADQ